MDPLGTSHERIYRRLLVLYPQAFRARFGDEMVQLFGDQLRDARKPGASIGGVAGTWLRTLGDLAVTVAAEHAQEDRTMAHSLAAPTRSTRALGILGIVGGALLAAAYLPAIPWTRELFLLRLVVLNLGSIAIAIALVRRLPAGSSRLALAAAAAVVLVNAWYAVMIVLAIDRPQPPDPDPDFRLVMSLSAAAMFWVDAAFGLVAMRFGGTARLGGIVLAVGAPLAFLGLDRLELASGPYQALIVPLALSGVALVGLGWILLGLDVVLRRRPAPAG